MSRKIDIGVVISRVFELYFNYAAVLLPVAALVFLVELGFRLLGLVGTALAVLAGVVSLILSTLYSGMVVELVNDVRDGRLDQSPGDLARSVGPVLVPLIAVSILAGIGIAIGFVLLIIPGLILVTMWAVVAPVTVLFILIFLAIGVVLGVIGALLGDVGGVILNYVGSVITAPLVALAAAVLYFELRAAVAPAPEQPAPPPTGPAAT